ncbi:MAG TPA: FAD-linked oxidase C-terminal domain-containing protein [Gemmataceae bacterium]|nr:FAD-linked oxidase C-terminal domain-containing protein [Gemmataceae bacterium]
MAVDEQQRERVQDDLKGIVRGELLFDDLSRALYSTDASIFQVQPLGVVLPRDEEDVQAIVRYAAEHQIPLVPRGAGTGCAGESLGAGLVLDLSRHFRSILEIGGDTVRVQPGVVYRDLNLQLARSGRRFAPNPASGGQCTIGGMLANNASGAHALKHGYTRDHVASLRCILDNGDAAAIGRERWWPAPTPADGRLHDIIIGIADVLQKNTKLIAACRPRTRFNRCGYLLQDVLASDYLDLARLLVGSEGTLAIFTEASLRTVPLPGGRAMVLLGFASLEGALRASLQSLSTRPAACDLIDRRLLSLVRGGDTDAVPLIPPGAEAVLLVEYESDTLAGARAAVAELIDRLRGAEGLALLATPAYEPEEIDRLWRLREGALPSLYALRGGRQPIAFIEDVGVPPEELPTYLHRVQEVLQRHETMASFLVHAGAGQVHARPFLDLGRPNDVAKLWAIADEVYDVALELGGTISTQHGTGLARTPWVSRQYGRLYPVFRAVKALFDPQRIFNPGKIVGPDPGMPAWPLRNDRSARSARRAAHAEQPVTPGVPGSELSAATHLRWLGDEMRIEILNCNGCGSCRTEAPAQRMCPIFRATHTEAASPRAKANLMRHFLNGQTDSRQFSSDEVREVADLCVNCKMCALECPAHVNIPKLMLEAKAANVAEHGLDRSDWALARTETFAAFGSTFAFLTNAVLASHTARWLLEKLFGVSRQRRLPAFASRSFLRRVGYRGWTKPPRSGRPRVAYFVDIFANYNDPDIAEAVVAVLRHNGIDVYVPPDQRGCGMAPLAYGDVDTARETARHNLRIFAELAREGFAIVCSEPTAALMLRHDNLDLLDDPDARLVADRTVELTTFLWELHQQGRLRTDFRPLPYPVGHHVPCHLKALGKPAAGPALLALIPGLRVRTIDVSCSGMAGTFGFKAKNYAVSLEAGRPMLDELRRPDVRFGSTECSSCRLQMEEGSRKRTLHPAQYLGLAYGLMPSLLRRLQKPVRDLVLQ